MSSYSVSKKYFSGIILHPELDKWELSVYRKLFPDTNLSIVDFGCGTGEFLYLIRKVFPNILGVDLNPYAIKSCKDKKIPVKRANILNTGIRSNTVNIVRAKEILEHIENPEKLIIEARRILKNNGYLVLHVPTQYSILYPITNFWDDYTHKKPFTKRGVLRLLSDFGFKVIYIKGYTVGRNFLETILGKIIEKFFPFSWCVISQKLA